VLAIISTDEEGNPFTTLTTVTAFEDDVLGALSTVEDAVLRSVRYVVTSVEPVTKLMAEPRFGDQVPVPADIVDHTFAFVDKLVANQREFVLKLVELLPLKVETPAPMVRSTPKARAT